MDEIDWTTEPMARVLVPTGPFDAERRVQPDYRDTVTGDVGPLGELSARPGATWHAFWAGVQCTRLSDGTVYQEPKAGGPPAPKPGRRARGFTRPTEALRR